MNTDNLILRETENLPLINKEDTLTSAELDGNFIKIYNDFIDLSQTNDPTLVYDIERTYSIDEFATYDGRLWIALNVSTGSTPIVDGVDWLDVFPTVLAHEKNKDTYLDYGGINATSVAEIRAFIDAGLTSTTNLSLTTKTSTSFKIESSTGADIIIPQATNVDAGLLNSTDKVKLNNLSGVNTGDQTLVSLNAENVDNKVTDFTTINNTLYPTTQAVDTYLTAQVPTLVETFIDTSVEHTENKAIDFTTVNDTLYPSVKAVDDHINSKLAGLWDDRGSYDASTNLFPSGGGSGGSGAILKGDIWTINVQGTLGGTVMHVGDTVRALVDTPAQTTSNWALLENAIGYVPENVTNKVTTFSGNTTSDTKYPSVKAVVDNFSSSNIKTILGITTLSGSNTGDQDLSGLMVKSNNLSDLTNTTTARTNLGLGSLATQSGTFSGTSSGTNTGDQTFLNARVQTVTSSATVTPVSTNDLVIITAQAAGLTLANPTGTFTEGQALMIRIKDNGTARTIAFDTNYRAIGVTLPTTTVISKTMYLGVIYNSTDSKWDVVGYNIQA
ncbi:hypothetical protein UFOVP200_28 [uncultured Caudovirales phage]|uniref:Tail fiber protein n=1 Tax=uncultured Caudovirales phage TaxID=2100421 RepID=A0A6J7WL80_9CAUD|nr:hypothetical protein UFOVP200_28 [uncultured Caudovirales phage]